MSGAMTGVVLFIAFLSLSVPWPGAAGADDWPTFRHDNRRSAFTPEELDAAGLETCWVFRSVHPPSPAWSGPAKWDAFAEVNGLRSMRNYDPVFHVIAAGGSLWFGSSAEDCVICLDAASGKEKWVFFADGPVRIAPTFHDNKIYFGSDDGCAYCLNAVDGSLVWRSKPSPDGPLIPNNGKFISRWPCRTGVLVEGKKAYFGASLLPWNDSFLCAVDHETGSLDDPGCFRRVFANQTMEGTLLASPTRLYLPQGRVPPVVFDLATGKLLGSLTDGGGAFALITADSRFLHGPGNKKGWITESRADTRDKIARHEGGNAMIVARDFSYLLTDTALVAIDRSSHDVVWTRECRCPCTLIMAGGHLYAGGVNEVVAFRAADGEPVWSGKVDGRAFGLATAGGCLLASTDTGTIHCFAPPDQAGGKER